MHLRWSRGGKAEILTLEHSDRMTLLSTLPFAPGSSQEGAFLNGAGTVRLKVVRCRRQGDRYFVEGRLLDVTRAVFAEIRRVVTPPPPEGTGGGSGP